MITFMRSLVFLLGMAPLVGVDAYAQQQPDIEVNISVLRDLPGKPVAQDVRRTVLKKPAEKDAAPVVKRADITWSPAPVPVISSAVAEALAQKPEPLPKKNDKKEPAQKAADNIPQGAKQFPIFTKTRSESSDPSLPESAPAEIPSTVLAKAENPPAPLHQIEPVADPVPLTSESQKQSVPDPLPAPETAPPTPDELLASMMEMEKSQIMAGVEDVVKQTGTRAVKASAPASAAELANIEPASGNPQDMSGFPNSVSISIDFPPSQIGIDNNLRAEIREKILPMLASNERGRVQIQAFATDDGSGARNARQRSMARALAVREYLLKQGINPSRLDIRALGMPLADSRSDRIDFVLMPQDRRSLRAVRISGG